MTSKTCGKCGAAIVAERGFCSACLLEAGLGARSDDPDETPDANAPPILMEFGDYELLEEIGRGGQGVVYRARQKNLNRIVALKVIGLGHWATEAHLKRFRHEAEAAAQLDHPSIVPIYEIGERDGACYFSMKFIEGGQLDEVVRREPLSIRRAVELIAKVARTVHHAHEHGVLHRDIKPGNILLDKNGEPHLTDFGLARLVEKESNVTRTMDVLGTPSYMAPEQAAGQNANLTSVTDVYGLGAVFYQLLTGQPPFAGGTTYETIRLVLETEPRKPRLWNSKVDRDVETICLKCLQKDPKKRYASALELAEDLERWLRHEPIRARRTGILTRSRKWVRRNPTTAVLAPALVALAIALGAMVWKGTTDQLRATGVAVLPFENLSAEKENALLADGVQDDILTKLAKVADLKVISRTSVMQYRGERNTRKIGEALRVSHVLEGSVQKAGTRLRLNAQLIDTRTDTHVWAEQYDRDLSDVFAVQSEIAQTIANQLSAKISRAEKTAMEKKPTQDLEAYNLYLRAKLLISRTQMLDPDSEQKYAQAAELLEQAVARDPNFALAYASLAEANLHLYWSVEKPPLRRTNAEAALQAALRLAPQSGEIHLARALFFYWGNLDYSRALEELEIAAHLLPNSADVFRLSAQVERRLGRWTEALRHFGKAAELDPRNVIVREALILTNVLVRRYPEAIQLADQAIVELPETGNDFVLLKARAAFDQGDFKVARASIERLSPTYPLTIEKFQLQFYLALYERNFSEARRLVAARPQMPHHEQLVPDVFFEGVVAEAEGDPVTARSAYLAAREGIEKQLITTPDIGIWISTQAQADAALGRREDALLESAKALRLTPDPLERPTILVDQAEVYCRLGDRDRAFEQLQGLANTPHGLTYSYLRLNPAWDSLRDDPRFAELLTKVAQPISLQ